MRLQPAGAVICPVADSRTVTAATMTSPGTIPVGLRSVRPEDFVPVLDATVDRRPIVVEPDPGSEVAEASGPGSISGMGRAGEALQPIEVAATAATNKAAAA
jgi:hypothetical protein